MTNNQAAAHESRLVRFSPRAPGFSCEQSASISLILQDSADATSTQPRDPTSPSFLHAHFMQYGRTYLAPPGIEPGLPRWDFYVTTTINVMLQILHIFRCHHYSPGLTLDILPFPVAAQDIFLCPTTPDI